MENGALISCDDRKGLVNALCSKIFISCRSGFRSRDGKIGAQGRLKPDLCFRG